MGMYDHYHPVPDVSCPVCGASGLEWQSKDGPCGLFVWEQGKATPRDQLVDDECKISTSVLETLRLPPRFEIYADCKCSSFIFAVGFTESNVWTKTELLNPANAVAYPSENERQFQKRLTALAKHPGHIR